MPRPLTQIRQAGFALMEVTMAIGMLTLGAVGTASVIMTARSAENTSRIERTSIKAAEELMEKIDGYAFDAIFASFNADPGDDPQGPGTAPGGAFLIDVLGNGSYRFLSNPADGKGVVCNVTIKFPVNAAGRLDETAAGIGMGTDLDLDGDGVQTTTDAGATYDILPVSLTIDWQSPGSSGSTSFLRVLGRKSKDARSDVTTNDAQAAGGSAIPTPLDNIKSLIDGFITFMNDEAYKLSAIGEMYTLAVADKASAARIALKGQPDPVTAAARLSEALALNTAGIGVGAMPASLSSSVDTFLTSRIAELGLL
ncbi:MAG: hypothetical protein KDB53_13045 [Planctomycetes bacterium]|nr:hypothetical protein [Planctomycetota bacterium]